MTSFIFLLLLIRITSVVHLYFIFCWISRLLVFNFFFLHMLSKKFSISTKSAVLKIEKCDLCLAKCLVNLSIFWIKIFLSIDLARVVLYFVQQSRVCLVGEFKQQFLVSKQYYTYFHTLFHSHVFQKIQTTLLEQHYQTIP